MTLLEFELAYKEQDWPAQDTYMYFGKCLSGDMKVAWDDMLENHFSNIDMRDDANWVRAKDTFVREYVNCKHARDVMLRALEHQWEKPVDIYPVMHTRRPSAGLVG